jgi:hypothetical protein
MNNTIYKNYVAYKPCKEPHLICKFHKKGPIMDLYEYGVRYKEDEIGYYSLRGTLICSTD